MKKPPCAMFSSRSRPKITVRPAATRKIAMPNAAALKTANIRSLIMASALELPARARRLDHLRLVEADHLLQPVARCGFARRDLGEPCGAVALVVLLADLVGAGGGVELQAFQRRDHRVAL